MKVIWQCEKCKEEFYDKQECINHEKKCNYEEIHICARCGKEELLKCEYLQESWHQINLGRMGYGSALDGNDVDFEICDNCLCEIIDEFKYKEDIYNSGSNTNYYYFHDDDLEDY
jgi:hypothetical protein